MVTLKSFDYTDIITKLGIIVISSFIVVVFLYYSLKWLINVRFQKKRKLFIYKKRMNEIEERYKIRYNIYEIYSNLVIICDKATILKRNELSENPLIPDQQNDSDWKEVIDDVFNVGKRVEFLNFRIVSEFLISENKHNKKKVNIIINELHKDVENIIKVIGKSYFIKFTSTKIKENLLSLTNYIIFKTFPTKDQNWNYNINLNDMYSRFPGLYNDMSHHHHHHRGVPPKFEITLDDDSDIEYEYKV